MAKILDFNAFEQPTLPLVMRDDAKTRLNVTAPSEALIERLEANYDTIVAACEGTDRSQNTMDAVRNLAADFISCNEENIKVTGDELRDKYKLNYVMLFAFFVSYMDMVNEIKTAKN